MARERLQKYIANCGYCSRRKAELLIEAGLVEVDGSIVRELGVKIDPARHRVRIHGEAVLPPHRRAVALHKPAGFITSTHDTHDRLTVMDLLPRTVAETGVLPAGRLDLETEGLLILTNDGDLQHRITHPRYECVKEYLVELDRPPRRAELDRLASGVYLPEFARKTAPAELSEVRRRRDDPPALTIRIREGMKRQIRRMFEELGMRVVYLKRLSIGGVGLGDLPRGEWRDLTPEEVASLEESAPSESTSPHPPAGRPPARDGANDTRGGNGRDRARGARSHPERDDRGSRGPKRPPRDRRTGPRRRR